VLTAFK